MPTATSRAQSRVFVPGMSNRGHTRGLRRVWSPSASLSPASASRKRGRKSERKKDREAEALESRSRSPVYICLADEEPVKPKRSRGEAGKRKKKLENPLLVKAASDDHNHTF